MENSAINFFLKNKDKLVEYMGNIKVNKEKTLVKFGFMKGKNLSITIMIYGPLDENITNFEEKINCMFNSKESIDDLNTFIEGINLPYNFHFNPFIKIGKDDSELIHAFNIAVKFEK